MNSKVYQVLMLILVVASFFSLTIGSAGYCVFNNYYIGL